MDPLVSVILPTYNRAGLLSRAINSVLGQSYSNLECIVIDDGSTDDTAQLVEEFKHDSRLRYLKHHCNKNGSASRNTGISESRGDFIAFLDDDDEWHLTKLEKQVKLLKSLPEKVGLVYCWMDYIDQKGNVVRRHYPTNRGNVFSMVIDNNRIGGCPTLLLRRAVIEKTGGFNDKLLAILDDHDFIIRACKHFEVDYVPEVMVKVYCEHDFRRYQPDDVIFRDSLKSYGARLEYLKDSAGKHKKEATIIYSVMANMCGRLNDWRGCAKYFYKAISTFALTVAIYRNLLSLIKYKITSAFKIAIRCQKRWK